MCALFANTSSALKMSHIGVSNRSSSRQFEVICRVRPHELFETAAGDLLSYADVVINEEKPTITLTSEVKLLSKEFAFHKIYNESTPQSQFTSEIIDEIFKATE